MTSDFDELASAHLDGETSEADAGRVESDRELLEVVEEFRLVAEALDVDVAPADEFLRGRQIGAALDAFDALGSAAGSTGAADTSDAVGASEATPPAADGESSAVDLARRRAERDRRTTRPGGLPRWLSVAAVLLLVVGGVGLLAQLGGSSDDEAATEAFDADDEVALTTAAGTERDAAGGEDVETEASQLAAGDAETSDDGASEAAESVEEGEDDSTADDGAAADDEAADEGDGQSFDGDDADTAAPAGSGGFFPEEQLEAATQAFDAVPDQERLLALADGPRFDPALATCAADADVGGDEVRFFVPVRVAGVDGEALFTGPDSQPTAVLVDGDCQPLG